MYEECNITEEIQCESDGKCISRSVQTPAVNQLLNSDNYSRHWKCDGESDCKEGKIYIKHGFI